MTGRSHAALNGLSAFDLCRPGSVGSVEMSEAVAPLLEPPDVAEPEQAEPEAVEASEEREIIPEGEPVPQAT